jgi:hypothetical protein
LKLRRSWDVSSQDIQLCDEIPGSHLYTILIYEIPHGSHSKTMCHSVVIMYLALYQPLWKRDFLLHLPLPWFPMQINVMYCLRIQNWLNLEG